MLMLPLLTLGVSNPCLVAPHVPDTASRLGTIRIHRREFVVVGIWCPVGVLPLSHLLGAVGGGPKGLARPLELLWLRNSSAGLGGSLENFPSPL